MLTSNNPTPQKDVSNMLFKRVKPLDVFFAGQRSQVENVNVVSISDNLVDEVTFKYTVAMGDVGSEVFVGDGIITFSGDDYAKWDASALGAYKLVCAGVGLELVDALKLFELNEGE